MHQRKLDRDQYMALFKKKQILTEKKLTQAEKDSLSALERDLPYDDIILYRKLANASVQREKQKEKERLAAERAAGGGGVRLGISKCLFCLGLTETISGDRLDQQLVGWQSKPRQDPRRG